jgi:hypothetical protein
VSIVRRARAFLVTGVLWAFAWAVVSVVPGVITYFLWAPDSVYGGFDLLWRVMLTWFNIFALTGAVSGLGFAALLSRAERERSIDELSLRRVAVWGAIAGFVMPLLSVLALEWAVGGGGTPVLGALLVSGFSGLFGAGAAVTSLKAAQGAVGPASPAPTALRSATTRGS